jgi:hypothetical protein
MPKCKNDPARSYKGDEPSPKGAGYCAHAEKVGAKRRGADGGVWVVAPDGTGRRRWVRLSSLSKAVTKATSKAVSKAKSGKAKSGKAPRDAPYTPEQERCMRTFVFYSQKMVPGQVSRSLFGHLEVDEVDGSKKIRLESGKLVDVPPPSSGFRRRPVPRQRLAEVYCKPRVDAKRLRAEAGAVTYEEWLRAAYRRRDLWFTLADVRAVLANAPGKPTFTVVSFHRNAGDHSAYGAVNPRGKAVDAARFFRLLFCRVTLLSPTGPQVRLQFFKNSRGDGGGSVPFETTLEVEYKPGHWYPLSDDGYLPRAYDPRGVLGSLLKSKTHWSDMDPATRVGWRGGFMRPEALSPSPSQQPAAGGLPRRVYFD